MARKYPKKIYRIKSEAEAARKRCGGNYLRLITAIGPRGGVVTGWEIR